MTVVVLLTIQKEVSFNIDFTNDRSSLIVVTKVP